eukprot:CAMPEP_0181203202 /NCGR_PEP_ID=MMETSP1096-20121128/19256_1 /TAXON_ID=156174 ORGANISM="Chrysochromulina ericina, Strain CCMP281" /NCGR_SAMPLE_ID=MMETSP1096 /ASSEMBLY_ACC=CAM_ASM_000453 /LENGTH=33 /DNA_ID= /DNA_START= /DNA_END= /DNA_ORIENTATION=
MTSNAQQRCPSQRGNGPAARRLAWPGTAWVRLP